MTEVVSCLLASDFCAAWCNFTQTNCLTEIFNFSSSKFTFRSFNGHSCLTVTFENFSDVCNKFLPWISEAKQRSSFWTSLWNVAGAFLGPNGMYFHWKCPKGVTKAETGIASSSRGTCKCPFERSIFVRNLAFPTLLYRIGSFKYSINSREGWIPQVSK